MPYKQEVKIEKRNLLNWGKYNKSRIRKCDEAVLKKWRVEDLGCVEKEKQ